MNPRHLCSPKGIGPRHQIAWEVVKPAGGWLKTGTRFALFFSIPTYSIILAAALCLSGTTAYAQASGQAATGGRTVLELPDAVELNVFGGVSIWGQVTAGLGEELLDGGTAGGRVAYNPYRYVGLELGYNFMINNVRLAVPIRPGLPTYNFGNQNHYWALNPIFNLTPRGSRVQPYITVGVGALQYTPTNAAETYARLPAVNAIWHSGQLDDNLQVALNYGGGVKFHISDHVGLRFDARGIFSRNPTYDLPNYNDGGIYIPARHHILGLEATMGLVFYIGSPKVQVASIPPPAPLSAGTITGGEGTLCQGKSITLHSTASDPLNHTLTYAWQMNGSASGSNSADFSFTPNNSGDFTVQVVVTDSTNPARTVTAGPVTLSVKEYVQPQITSVTSSPDGISCAADASGTHTASLSGQATGSACGGNLTYKWTVSEGSVTNDTSPNATFDASTLTFEGGAQGQTKTVVATLTVTDETGKSVSGTTNVSVKCPPQFVRLSDVVFAKNNARVNNCGKRILIDEAAPRATSGDYDIVLVGHRADDETGSTPGVRRGRTRVAGWPLDEQRVLNAAAVLTAGTGTCARVDPARVKVDWVGNDQTSTPDPGLCGTSNRSSQKERRGSAVTEADKSRRVEVYLVPRNSSAQPPAVKNVKPLPESEVKAIGCPR